MGVDVSAATLAVAVPLEGSEVYQEREFAYLEGRASDADRLAAEVWRAGAASFIC